MRQALQAEQFRAELLVAGVQLLLAAGLALGVAATPPDFAPDAPVQAVPLGLSLFALLVLLRLYAAWTGQLGPALLAAGVVAEMAVLIGTLALLHLQYEQPPQFALKGPAFVYVFVLIGLRALRFEPLWVAVSGGTALLGWVALLGWSLWRAPSNPLTWDYVTALRSFQIHFGAEAQRLLALALFTATLTLALARARSLLRRALAQQHAVADLSLFFDAAVARRITASEAALSAGQGERRQVAILFLDLRGFTPAAARLGPEGVIALLGEYQRLVVPIVRRHGGSIDKYLGDGILASFGAVAPDAVYAARALRAVDEIVRAVDGWRAARTRAGLAAPDVGAGLATGEVVFGIVGDGRHLEYTVIGDAVNLAAKLEKHNKAQGTRALATQQAYEQARAQGYEGEKALCGQVGVVGAAELMNLAVLAGRPGQ
ncbi:adenylate/guanylate cyclase domain-containing protein [Azohydromonas caseinilytica]|uniref:Adenylate/guanylate cyclase domain-containing protein n=1 Tax=Azohydromonas caseinilytica TaxID=2728836 RepID=A0A848FAS5_9BURK|nr:adenylate/guanylate cyclase domain-containing protein [Azohydromonas caseinilytica]NML15423.1 adenylate/guanylate cyclase domain-containing protein [Azohydromonas caseinilytica]